MVSCENRQGVGVLRRLAAFCKEDVMLTGSKERTVKTSEATIRCENSGIVDAAAAWCWLCVGCWCGVRACYW